MGRAPCCDKNTVKRGPWSPEEDATLKKYIEKNGHGGNWIALPHKSGLNRCGKSCRLRWLNYLRPNIRHGAFTEEEDNIIFTLYKKIGSRWSVIASKLNGRTDNDVKNYWNTKLKRKLNAKRQTNITNKSKANYLQNYQPSTTPQLPATTKSTVKTEDYNYYYSTSDFSGLTPFPAMKLVAKQPDFSYNTTEKAVNSSAASSSCTSSFSDWTSNENDMLLPQFGFGEGDDFVSNFGYQDMLGEELLSGLGNIWSDIEYKA